MTERFRAEALELLREAENLFVDVPFEDMYQNELTEFLAGRGYSVESGATRDVWVGTEFVIKFPNSVSHDSYCKAEVENYTKAVAAGFGDMFAECEFLDYFLDSIPCYIMEVATLDPDAIMDKAITDSAIEDGAWVDSCEVVRDTFKEVWGVMATDALYLFLDANDINDVHNYNVGWIGSRLVITDYAGY